MLQVNRDTVAGAKHDAYGESLSHASVLIVDDEPGMRNFLSKTLEPHCKRVALAACPKDAAIILDSSALLTDDGRGLDVDVISALVKQLAQLRESGCEVVLVSSGAVAAGQNT